MKDLANIITHLQEEAFSAYEPQVDALCKNPNATENEVGLMLDWLLMYCDNPKILDLYKKVCRTFYQKYPFCIAQYIAWYREEYEDNE